MTTQDSNGILTVEILAKVPIIRMASILQIKKIPI
jgi:hypothetical protein